jgi:hypothetical protein
MEWDVQLDEDFAAWLAGLEADQRNEIIAPANLLRERARNSAALTSICWRVPPSPT